MNKGTRAMLTHLYRGGIISNLNILELFGYTNCSREICRKIEQPFNLTLVRKTIKKKSRWGEDFRAYEYSLKKEDKQKVIELLNGSNL
mgnify:CR=1 FL=1